MRTVTVFIAVIPWDYSHSDVELCETRQEAEQYIKDNSPRGDVQYCSVLEWKVVCE